MYFSDAKEIILWLKRETGLPAQLLETSDAAKAFVDVGDVVVVGFFQNPESDSAKAYMSAADAEDMKRLYFGIVSSQEVAEFLDASFDSVVVFKKFDEGRATLDKDFTAENIKAFVLLEQLPLVPKYSMQVCLW